MNLLCYIYSTYPKFVLPMSKLTEVTIQARALLLEIPTNLGFKPWVGDTRGISSGSVEKNAGILTSSSHGGHQSVRIVGVRLDQEAASVVLARHHQLGCQLTAEVQVPGTRGILDVHVPERRIQFMIRRPVGDLLSLVPEQVLMISSTSNWFT